jgi:hypothetical protein
MREPDAPKADWLSSFPAGPPDKEGLARIVDADGGQDDAENSYYEEAADPGFIRMEKARRGFRGQYLRRLRRLAGRDRFDRACSGRPSVMPHMGQVEIHDRQDQSPGSADHRCVTGHVH